MSWFSPLKDDAPLDFDPPQVLRKVPRATRPVGNRNSLWTDERIVQLRKLWTEDGLSAAKVAAELGHGITRNAVISKVNRLGIPPRKKASTAKQWPSVPRKAAIRPELRAPPKPRTVAPFLAPKPSKPEPVVMLDLDPATNVTIHDLTEHTCKWPVSDDPRVPVEEFFYCGAATEIGPYCLAHHGLAYAGVPPRRYVQPRPRT